MNGENGRRKSAHLRETKQKTPQTNRTIRSMGDDGLTAIIAQSHSNANDKICQRNGMQKGNVAGHTKPDINFYCNLCEQWQ